MELGQYRADNETIMTLVSGQLNRLMKMRGIETSDLVKATGISTSLVNMYRRGEGNPSLANIFKLAHFFGKPVSFFIEPDYESVQSFSDVMPVRVYDINNLQFSEGGEQYILTLKKERYAEASFAVRVYDDSQQPSFKSCRRLLIPA